MANPVAHAVEAVLRPALALAFELMARLVLAPLRALLGPREPEPEPVEAPDDPRLTAEQPSPDGAVAEPSGNAGTTREP